MPAKFRVHVGDSLKLLKKLPANSIDSCVCDPPYHLTNNKKGGSGVASLNLNSPAGRARISTGGGFMGMKWDGGDIAFTVDLWREVLRVLKPGAHLLAFGGTRTYHWMVCAIEDAGFEIRDQIGWLYGSGFPKSLDVSKAIDKAAGAKRKVVGVRKNGCGNTASSLHKNSGFARSRDTIFAATAAATAAATEWQGWGTALKPAWEPIVLARKPLIGTVAENVQRFGTGAINVEQSRVAAPDQCDLEKQWTDRGSTTDFRGGKLHAAATNGRMPVYTSASPNGRWPANVIHDGSDEVLGRFPQQKTNTPGKKSKSNGYAGGWGPREPFAHDKEGSAARFFYCAKATKKDREAGLREAVGGSIGKAINKNGKLPVYLNTHPTVKPTALMRYLVRLITPPGGTVLDCFTGSGSTGKAAMLEGFNFIGIELSKDYARIARTRIAAVAK